MQPLFADRRRPLGAFEVVDFVDEAEIARLRAQLDVDTPLRLRWTWTYASEVAELRALYEKGKVSQWNAETDLDWSTPCPEDEWLADPRVSILAQAARAAGRDEATQRAALRDEVGYVLSQLLHGEQAALQLCGQLTNVCPTLDEKSYAASQVVDEARHVEAFAKLLQRKLGELYPVGPTLKSLLELLLQADSARMKTLGMQTLFEGMAVGIMDRLRRESRNPLLAETLRRVEQDESRHAAFGVLSMRRVVAEASREELEQMEDFAFRVLEALNANQRLDMLRLLAPRYGLDPERVARGVLEHPHFVELNSPPYTHTVVPNLCALGLLTDRTRAAWAERGMLA